MMELCKGTIIHIIYNIKVAANIYRKNYILYFYFLYSLFFVKSTERTF